jgi:hypothetical protein
LIAFFFSIEVANQGSQMAEEKPKTKNQLERARLNHFKSQLSDLLLSALTPAAIKQLQTAGEDEKGDKLVVNLTNVKSLVAAVVNSLCIGSSELPASCTRWATLSDETLKTQKPLAYQNIFIEIAKQKSTAAKTQEIMQHFCLNLNVINELQQHYEDVNTRDDFDGTFPAISFTKRFRCYCENPPFCGKEKRNMHAIYKLHRNELEWVWQFYAEYREDTKEKKWTEDGTVVVPPEFSDFLTTKTNCFTKYTHTRDYAITPGNFFRFCFDLLSKKLSELETETASDDI